MIEFRGECLMYLRDRLLLGDRRITLKVMAGTAGEHEWTEAGREDFGMEPPATINVEVTAGTARRRHTSVYEYRRPRPIPMHSTPRA
jgi:hypothetical protein